MNSKLWSLVFIFTIHYPYVHKLQNTTNEHKINNNVDSKNYYNRRTKIKTIKEHAYCIFSSCDQCPRIWTSSAENLTNLRIFHHRNNLEKHTKRACWTFITPNKKHGFVISREVINTVMSKSRYYKERQVDRKSVRRFVSIRHGRHVLSQCPKQRQSPSGNIKKCLLIPGGKYFCLGHWLRTWRIMTNADESPTNRLTLFWLNFSLFLVSTIWLCV